LRILTFFGLLLTLLLASCAADDTAPIDIPELISNNPEPEPEPVPEPEVEEEPSENPNPIGTSAGDVTFLNESLVDDNYILVNDARNNFVYLMDKTAKVVHQWNLNGGDLGNDCFLLPNGKLLAMVESEDPTLLLGGYGGKLELLDSNGTVEWSFIHSTDDYIIHHDAEMLPNGNVLIMTWERRTKEEATANGYSLDVELFPDGLIEVNPANDEIIWEWRVWDHLIQDFDNSKTNFGSISENPQLIDLNYNQNENGDITHANGIAYDAEKDIIYLSANFYSEVWVIDHSTTTEEAAAHTGGTYSKGGDLIYRFGNPSAYNNLNGERLFFNNHYPNLLDGTDKGNMLIYSNGAGLEQSTVYELALPTNFVLDSNASNEPSVIWSFTDPELYSPKVSGAVKLPNGNILITEGDFGIWEVTQEKEIIWKFSGDGFYWRAYHFNKNDPEILSLNLE
jgi:hypothetical protein